MKSLKNEKRKHSRRGLALFLAMMMCASMIQVPSFAVSGGEQGPELICTVDEHSHGEECYETSQVETLVCDIEDEEHEHEDSCYITEEMTQLVCEISEHVHDDGCYAAVEAEENEEPIEEPQEIEETAEPEEAPELDPAMEQEAEAMGVMAPMAAETVETIQAKLDAGETLVRVSNTIAINGDVTLNVPQGSVVKYDGTANLFTVAKGSTLTLGGGVLSRVIATIPL